MRKKQPKKQKMKVTLLGGQTVETTVVGPFSMGTPPVRNGMYLIMRPNVPTYMWRMLRYMKGAWHYRTGHGTWSRSIVNQPVIREHRAWYGMADQELRVVKKGRK